MKQAGCARRWRRAAPWLALFVLLGGGGLPAQQAPEARLRALPLHGLRAEVATLIVGGGDGGSLAMAGLAWPREDTTRRESEPTSVPVLFELEGATLLEGVSEAEERLIVEFYAYAIDEEGSVRGFLSCGVEVSLPELGEVLYESGLKLLADLDLVPGHYSLRLLAREPSSGRYALRTLPILVPGASESSPRLSVPLVAEASGGWLLAEESSTGGEGGAAEDFPRLERADELLLPTGLAILPLGQTITVDVEGAGLPSQLRVTASVASHRDDHRTELRVELRDRRSSHVGSGERLGLRLEIPADLPVGTYRLDVKVEGGDVRLASGLETVVLPAPDLDLVWGQVRHYLSGDILRRRMDVSFPRGGRRDRRQIDPQAREAYVSVLERLVSTSQMERAVAELVRREGELFSEDPTTALQRLRDTEVAMARLLAARFREGLLPLLVLHLEAYRAHRSRRDFALATHARLTAGEIAELYAADGEDSSAAKLASVALICLAGDMTESRLWKQSDLLLARAIELDPTNVEALLLLASNGERFGEYATAADLAGRAVEADPRADEARLRLAVNQVRLRRFEEAERNLRRLLNVEAEEWVLVLAYEELTRLLLRRSHLQEAVREARRGLSRHPSQQGLYVLLAYLLERLGSSEEGTLVLQRMPEATGNEPSPRFRYAQPRNENLMPLRTMLFRSAEVRIPMLAGVLSDSSEG